MEDLSLVDYSRQEELHQTLRLNLENINIIVGCGGIGYWTGIMLAMLGHKNFILIDGDNIDNTNLGRLPVPQTWIGRNKAIALRKGIRTLRPNTKVLCLSTHLTEDTFGIIDPMFNKFRTDRFYGAPSIRVWDTTDHAHVQRMLYNKTKERNHWHYRKLGYEAFEIGSYANMDVWTADDYTAGYRTTNANGITSALSAGIGIFAGFLRPNHDVQMDLRSIIMSSTDHANPLRSTSQEIKTAIEGIDTDILDDMAYDRVMDVLRAKGVITDE